MPSIRVLVIAPCPFASKLDKIKCAGLHDGCELSFDFKHRFDEDMLDVDLVNFRPHAILSVADLEKLPLHSFSATRKWVRGEGKSPAEMAAAIINVFIALVGGPSLGLMSVFTATYHTPRAALIRCYHSLTKQSYRNWEWVVYDDSKDNETFKRLTEIANTDHRVRVFKGTRNSGSIGDVKRCAAGLCRGQILVELDHDDELTMHCLHYIGKAFEKYPDAGFAYTHCSEVGRPLNGDGWAYGQGAYRKETYEGREYDVAISPAITSTSIRHICSSPNHVRAWRASTYWQAGGHNPHIDVADDYELMVRTFLATRMVRINYLGYLQHYHDSNTQNARLKEIQRIVQYVRWNYDPRINQRFAELGVPDYAMVGERNVNFSLYVDDPHYANYEYFISPAPRMAVVTACTRPENIERIHASFGSTPVHWIIIEDADALGTRRVTAPPSIHKITVLSYSNKLSSHVGGQCLKNRGIDFVLSTSKEEWIYFLDDDTIMLPHFMEWMRGFMIGSCPPIIAFGQHLEGGGARGAQELVATKVDQGQYILKTSIIGGERIPIDYRGDGMFIEKLAKSNPVWRHNWPLCFYNRLSWRTS